MGTAVVQGFEQKRAFAVVQSDAHFFRVDVGQKIKDEIAVKTALTGLPLYSIGDLIIAFALFRRRPFHDQFVLWKI